MMTIWQSPHFKNPSEFKDTLLTHYNILKNHIKHRPHNIPNRIQKKRKVVISLNDKTGQQPSSQTFQSLQQRKKFQHFCSTRSCTHSDINRWMGWPGGKGHNRPNAEAVRPRKLSCMYLMHCGAQWSSICVLDCQVRGPRFNLGQGRNLYHDFWSTCTPIPPLEPQVKWIWEIVPSLEPTKCEDWVVETLVGCKGKHKRSPITQEQKRRPENPKDMEKKVKEALDTSGLCAQGSVEDRPYANGHTFTTIQLPSVKFRSAHTIIVKNNNQSMFVSSTVVLYQGPCAEQPCTEEMLKAPTQ